MVWTMHAPNKHPIFPHLSAQPIICTLCSHIKYLLSYCAITQAILYGDKLIMLLNHLRLIENVHHRKLIPHVYAYIKAYVIP